MSAPERGATSGSLTWLGVFFLAMGLAGHLAAANAEGGHAIHFRHHITGFVLLSVVSGVILALLGRFFWKGRHDITLLMVGILQTILGWWVYVMFSRHMFHFGA